MRRSPMPPRRVSLERKMDLALADEVLARYDALQQRKPLQRHTPIAKQSAKKRAGNRKYGSLRQRCWERDEGTCRYGGEALDPDTWQLHHVLPRSAGGKDVLSNAVALCPDHHRWVHTDGQNEAVERGLLRRRYGQEAA